MYEKLCDYSNHEDRRLKSDHFRNLIKENKSDNNKMWKALKQMLPSRNCSEVKAIKVKKTFLLHPREIAEVLNKHFSMIGQKLANAICSSGEEVLVEPKSKSKFSLNHVSTEFVTRQLRGLKTNKAAGLDKISARLLKDSADIISPVFQNLINLSINQNSFLNSWKSAKVVALFKNGGSSDCGNYRPISILPTASKILERAVCSQFYAHLENEKLLFVRQFGFHQSMSMSHALSEFCDSLLNNMDRGNVSGVIYFDLKKAFDTVNHAILLKKLNALGVDSNSLLWFKSYLRNRTQHTAVAESISNQCRVTTGVPQGSILGPLLFLAYINDMPADCLQHTQASLFADDTVLYCTAPSSGELEEKLNNDLSRIRLWLNRHKLTLNASKSKFTLIGGSRCLKSFGSITLKIEEEEIEQVTSYKYLGVKINETLTWSNHVESICKKVAQRLGLLQHIKHLLPQYLRELLVNSLILPLLDYADIVWGDKKNKALMDNLQVLHNKAAKFVLNLPNRESSTKALTHLSWKPLSVRRKIHRCTFVFRTIQTDKEQNPLIFPNVQGQDYYQYNTRSRLKF